jgi:HAD superfamily hydrolase (TIGR01549 family)
MSTPGAVVFDAGETIFSEERLWREWAAWLDVSFDQLMDALDAAISERRDHVTAFEAVKPGFDLDREREKRAATRYKERFTESDLYPDALRTIDRLKSEGYVVGVAGNHPRGFLEVLRELDPRIDFIASSEEWGVPKPERAFFERAIRSARHRPSRTVYVGDRLDNDVLPAVGLGMLGLLVRRGPWGLEHRKWPDAVRASAQVDGLDEIPDLLPALLGAQEELP